MANNNPNSNHDRLALIVATIIAAIVLCSVFLTGCKSAEPIIRTDSIYINKVQVDTVYQSAVKWDSIYVHDSIFVSVSDSLTVKEVWKWKYQYQIIHDTLYQYRTTNDSAYINHTDTIVKWCEKSLTKWQQFKLEIGGFCMILLLVFIIYTVISVWRKFR